MIVLNLNKKPQPKTKPAFRFDNVAKPITKVRVLPALENKSLEQVVYLWKIAISRKRKDKDDIDALVYCLKSKFNREVPK